MFDGFETATVDADETSIFVRRKGNGPPLLLLHGFPETHAMWHAVAPALADSFTVICADLRGYGASGKPPSTSDHAPYSKAAMARDMVQTMQRLGLSRFSVAGHDRGGRVAYRMALDHPDCIARLAVLDIIPTGAVFERADMHLTLGYWPWSLLAQPEPLPERMITASADAVVDKRSQHGARIARVFRLRCAPPMLFPCVTRRPSMQFAKNIAPQRPSTLRRT